MKILAIGDFHGKFPSKLKREAKKADLILCTGDLGGSNKLLKIIFKHFKQKWWKKVGEAKAKKYVLEDYNNGKRIINELENLSKKIYVISGNWDFTTSSKAERDIGLKIKPYSLIMKDKKNLVYTNRALRNINGLNILFFGGMVTAGAYTKGVFDRKKTIRFVRKNKEETDRLMKYSNKDVDILFAHYPAFGYFDEVKFKGKNPMNGEHVGFKGYTNFIKKNEPKLFICGHMHEYQGKKKLGNTLIISTGSAKEGKAAFIDIDEKKRKVINVKFLK